MATHEPLDFLNTLGREFCAALQSAGISEPTGQDCYSVLAENLGSVSIHSLSQVTSDEWKLLAEEFNAYFESSGITAVLLKAAAQRTLGHWQE